MKLFRNQKSLPILFAALATFTIGCDDDDEKIDEIAPAIEIHDPVEGEMYATGDRIQFEAHFTDNVGLASFNVEIHENFDGHGHGRIEEDPSLAKFVFKQSYAIDGNLKEYEAEFTNELEIAENATGGPYHFVVQAIDASGNSTSFADESTKEVAIWITNDSQPLVNITNASSGELELEEGEAFVVEGDISDPTEGEFAGIEEVIIELAEPGEHEEHDHDHGGRFEEGELMEIELHDDKLAGYLVDGKVDLTQVFADAQFVLSDEEKAELDEEGVDHLELQITVHDNQGNISYDVTEVHVE